MPSRYKWDYQGATDFINMLNDPDTIKKFNNLTESRYPPSKTQAELDVKEFTDILQQCAAKSLRTAHPPKKLPHKKWFDRECEKSKRNLTILTDLLVMSVNMLTIDLKINRYTLSNVKTITI